MTAPTASGRVAAIRERAVLYWRLTRMHRPIGTLLLLWPTLAALWIASRGWPEPYLLFAFVLGTLLMRSAGCAINDWADRDFDRHVARTRDRPLTSGAIEPWEAVAVFVVLSLVALLLIVPMNRMVWALAVVAAFLAASYPFTKRFLALPQAYLGIAFGFGIPMAFAAVRNELPAAAWTMLASNVFWALAYDTEYAMVDRDEDIAVGAKSTAILFGDADRAILGVLMVTFVGAMALAGSRAGLGWIYFVGVAVAAVQLARQQQVLRDRSREHCFAAFRNNHWVGFALWAGLMLALAAR